MYFKQIDSFRFVAAISVVAAHWLQAYPFISNIPWGKMGVDFFFVISGFLITLQLLHSKKMSEEKKITRRRALYVFYARRSLRIFPLYYLVVLSATLYFRGELVDAFWWNMSYCSNFYFIEKYHWGGLFSHLWSLSVEEHFYLFWPILVLLVKRKWLPMVFISIFLFAIAFKTNIFITRRWDYFSFSIHTFSCLDQLMIGGGLAYIYLFHPNRFTKVFSSRITTSVVLSIFTGLCVLYWYKTGNKYFDLIIMRIMCGLVFGFIVGLLANGFKGVASSIFENKIWVYLGKLSYGIYLLHNFVPEAIPTIHYMYLHPMLEFGIYVLITIMGADILHRWVEIPFRRLYPQLHSSPSDNPTYDANKKKVF